MKYGLSDLAYAEIYFDITPPPSILQINKAKNIAVGFLQWVKLLICQDGE